MRKYYIALLLALISLPLAVDASAKAIIDISMKAEKEVTVDKVTKRIAADKVEPGNMIFYTLSYVNTGDEQATNVVLDDPIPKGTMYVAGTVFGEGAEISFSIDGGKTFKKASLLTYEVKLPNGKIETRNVSPEKYTHIRWTVGIVSAKGSGKVGFQVQVK